MEQISLGGVSIAVQKESDRNEDVYRISGKEFVDGQNTEQITEMIRGLEDPERFVVNTEGSGVNVYTKQPDAVIELALHLNRLKGTVVSENETEAVRHRLFQQQQ